MNILYRSSAFLTATTIAMAFLASPSLAESRDSISEQKATAAAIMEREARNARLAEPASGRADAAMLVSDVGHGLVAVGIRGVDPGSLSLGAVQRLSLVFATHDGGHRADALAILEEDARRAQLARYVAEVPGAAGNAMVTVADLRGLGLEVDDLGSLTLGQLLAISSTLGQREGSVDQELQITRILALQ